MSLADDAQAALGRSPLDKATAIALVSIAQSLERLVDLKCYEVHELGGFDPEELFAHYSRPVVDTGPLPGGSDDE